MFIFHRKRPSGSPIKYVQELDYPHGPITNKNAPQYAQYVMNRVRNHLRTHVNDFAGVDFVVYNVSITGECDDTAFSNMVPHLSDLILNKPLISIQHSLCVMMESDAASKTVKLSIQLSKK